MTSRLPGPLRRVSRLRSRGVSRLSLRAALEAQDDIATTLLSVGSETRGLSEEEAVRRLARHGPNRLSAAGPRRRTTVLKAALTDLQSLSLLLIGLVALLASPANLPGFLVMVLLVALTAVGALLRNRANRQTALDLAELAGTASTVLRRQGNGEPDWRTISSSGVVRGDIVRLGPGYRVPADLRLIEAQQLTVDQSLMTGDSSPVAKSTGGSRDPRQLRLRSNPLDPPSLPNILLTGSFVLGGTGTGVVVATGEQTYYGSMARALLHDHGDAWDIQFGSALFLPRLLLLVPIAAMLRAGYAQDLPGLLWLTLAAAVFLLPELLPALFLPRTIRTERESGALEALSGWLRRLRGSGESRPERFRDADLRLISSLDMHGDDSAGPLRCAWLISTLSPTANDAVDTAVLRYSADHPGLDLGDPAHYELIDQIPYELKHRRHSLIAADAFGQHLLLSRGNADRILEVSSRVRSGVEAVPLEAVARQQLLQHIRVQLHQGNIVQLIATRLIPANRGKRLYSVSDERELTVEGLLVLSPAESGVSTSEPDVSGHAP